VGLLALVTAARPGTAQCPQLEPSFTITGVTGTGSVQTSADQATLGLTGCATLRFVIVSQPGSIVTDVTSKTTFVTDPTRGTVTGNIFCVSAADCNHQFPVYGIYHDPCSGTNLVATVHITVVPCPVVAPAPGCPQLEPLVSIEEVTNGTINSRDQATLNVGGCVELELRIVSEPGGAVTEVTDSPNTTFVSPGRGIITSDTDGGTSETGEKNIFCATVADCNHQFPVYAIYHDPCTGTNLVATVHITVVPCPVVSPAAGCPQFEQIASFATVNGVATTGSPDQATLSVGQCATFHLIDIFQPGGVVDETFDTDTHFVSDHGTITGNKICIGPADANHQFTVYAIYREGCTNTTITSTLHVTVRP